MPLRHTSPHVAPAVRRECLLDQPLGIGRAGKVDAVAVENERQGGIVRNRPVVGEIHSDGRGVFDRGRHEDVRVPATAGLSF
jgi:hypothetical protein